MKKEILEFIREKTSMEVYDAICELQMQSRQREKEDFPNREQKTWDRNEAVDGWIEDCLDTLEITEELIEKWIKKEVEIDMDEKRDATNSYADTNTEIYNYFLWKHAPVLSDFIEDAILEYGLDMGKDITLIKIFQQGEYYFYEQFAREVLDGLEQYVEEIEMTEETL